MTGCVSSRTATKSSELRVESVESVEKVDSVIVMVFDTITITKTITIRENESGDTLRVSTVTERDHVRDRSQLKVKSEKLKVETDTVYVERDSLRLTAYGLPGTEIDEQGNVTKKVNRVAQSLKWLFLTLVAVIAIIILMRIKLRR